MSATDALLFSYGTLQLDHVQRTLFGRSLVGTPDRLTGYAIVDLPFRDPAAVATSGVVTHLALVPDDDAPAIDGMAYELTAIELAAADVYETEAYTRVAATFASGRRGWVYVRS